MRIAPSLLVGAFVMYARAAAADGPEPATFTLPTDPEEASRMALELSRLPPPPSHQVYFQYGVAFTSESILSAGAMCNNAALPCVLGSGGGIILRGGWRGGGQWYFGGAYEVSKQDPDKLYRMATLQQARGEARYYITTHRMLEPYVHASAGLVGYGNQWTVDTWGPSGSLGAGIEYQVTQRTVIGIAAGYRLAYFSRFEVADGSNTSRAPSGAQMFGLDFILEQRDALLSVDPAQ